MCIYQQNGYKDREDYLDSLREDYGDVVLLGDISRLCHENAMNGVALDVHSEDVASTIGRLFRSGGQLDASGLAAATGLDLGLDDHGAADFAGSLVGGIGGGAHLTGRDRNSVCFEQGLGLVLVQIHSEPFDVRYPQPTEVRRASAGVVVVE